MVTRAGSKAIGVHGLEIMSVLYRTGCATAEDIGWIMDIDRRAANRQLLLLHESGFVQRLKARPSWEHGYRGSLTYIYYLSRTGIPVGGGSAGIEDGGEAGKRYRRCRAVSLFSHRLMQTRFLARLAESTRFTNSSCSLTDFWAEHAPGFPLGGLGGKNDSYISHLSYGLKAGDIVPDGRIEASVLLKSGRQVELSPLFESETGSRNLADVYANTLAYLAYLEMRCYTGDPHPTAEDPGGGRYLVQPVEPWPAIVFLSPTQAAAENMRRYVWERLEDHEHYGRWVRRMLNQHAVDPAYFFLFASLEAMNSSIRAPLERVYAPLEPYPTVDGQGAFDTVALHDVASMVASCEADVGKNPGYGS